jgi:hypothetical protein
LNFSGLESCVTGYRKCLSIALIRSWMERLAQFDAHERQTDSNLSLKPDSRTLGVLKMIIVLDCWLHMIVNIIRCSGRCSGGREKATYGIHPRYASDGETNPAVSTSLSNISSIICMAQLILLEATEMNQSYFTLSTRASSFNNAGWVICLSKTL